MYYNQNQTMPEAPVRDIRMQTPTRDAEGNLSGFNSNVFCLNATGPYARKAYGPSSTYAAPVLDYMSPTDVFLHHAVPGQSPTKSYRTTLPTDAGGMRHFAEVPLYTAGLGPEPVVIYNALAAYIAESVCGYELVATVSPNKPRADMIYAQPAVYQTLENGKVTLHWMAPAPTVLNPAQAASLKDSTSPGFDRELPAFCGNHTPLFATLLAICLLKNQRDSTQTWPDRLTVSVDTLLEGASHPSDDTVMLIFDIDEELKRTLNTFLVLQAVQLEEPDTDVYETVILEDSDNKLHINPACLRLINAAVHAKLVSYFNEHVPGVTCITNTRETPEAYLMMVNRMREANGMEKLPETPVQAEAVYQQFNAFRVATSAESRLRTALEHSTELYESGKLSTEFPSEDDMLKFVQKEHVKAEALKNQLLTDLIPPKIPGTRVQEGEGSRADSFWNRCAQFFRNIWSFIVSISLKALRLLHLHPSVQENEVSPDEASDSPDKHSGIGGENIEKGTILSSVPLLGKTGNKSEARIEESKPPRVC